MDLWAIGVINYMARAGLKNIECRVVSEVVSGFDAAPIAKWNKIRVTG